MGTVTIAPPKTKRPDMAPPQGGNRQGGNGPEAVSPQPSPRTYRMGMWVALIPILMLFLSLTSALVVRKGLGEDWKPTPIPMILWFNTAILLASSFTLEKARRALGKFQGFQHWLWITTALGLTFLAGQFLAWQQLASTGVYLASNPSSSFFYLLTATHGIHLLGGLGALFYLDLRAPAYAGAGPAKATAVEVTAIYWHFLDGLWIYLLLLFLFGR